jgi:hypothetical protein
LVGAIPCPPRGRHHKHGPIVFITPLPPVASTHVDLTCARTRHSVTHRVAKGRGTRGCWGSEKAKMVSSMVVRHPRKIWFLTARPGTGSRAQRTYHRLSRAANTTTGSGIASGRRRPARGGRPQPWLRRDKTRFSITGIQMTVVKRLGSSLPWLGAGGGQEWTHWEETKCRSRQSFPSTSSLEVSKR